MGFNSVYQTLKELFPQVDARILKAVAIEHSKDPNVAVESILIEVLPFIDDQSGPTSDVKSNGKAAERNSQNSAMLVSTAEYTAAPSDSLIIGHNVNSLPLNETPEDSLASSFYDAKDSDDHLNGNSKRDELIAPALCAQASVKATQENSDSLRGDNGENVCGEMLENHESEGCFTLLLCVNARDDHHFNNDGGALSTSANVKDIEADASSSNGRNVQPDCFNGLASHDRTVAASSDCCKEQAFLDCNSLVYQDATEEALLLVKDQMLDALDLNLPEPEKDMLHQEEHHEASSYVDADFKHESSVTDAVDNADETTLSTIVTRSGHICRIDLLEDLIENAKCQKDTLFSAMESVVGLIEEVELQEKAAEQAKKDAIRGGLKTLEKVEEIKKMLKHAKEANDMHAGEVYGEKSILATEVKELQNRLLGLSDEKDKSISILDEMRKTLEAQLAIAEEERKKAEQEMFEKEENARSALAEQELIMEKVVQESKLLQQEAAENAKLRDFLMDKGRVVDILQGEISVICQDVRSLKENFDNCISLSKPPSIKHTSSSQSSSLNSSVKSLASDTGAGQVESLESPTNANRTPSVGNRTPSFGTQTPSVGSQTPRSCVGEEQPLKRGATPRKELLDEGWELF